jgi:hypothetical protein
MLSEAWKQKAVCRPEHAALMTAESKPGDAWISRLGQLCATCPVAVECARYAVSTNGQGFFAGVWVFDRGPQRQVALHVLSRKAGMR